MGCVTVCLKGLSVLCHCVFECAASCLFEVFECAVSRCV